ncbi:MAG: DUF2332 domain-containing protein [Aquabacterium sp.]|nr:DUF2332 domain-containing protein [Aquabacterium sp.]
MTHGTDATAPGEASATPDGRRRQFLHFADRECGEDPLYVALCHLLALRPAALTLLDAAPRTQQRPNLLLAAIHERVLDGAGGALAGYFPSAGGDRMPDAALAAALDDCLDRERVNIQAHVAGRSTQTNEIGRCAVLWPLLAQVAADTGARLLALMDFGCSAGLNLGVDHYRYRHGDVACGAPEEVGTPEVDCHPVHGRRPPACPAPRIDSRLGVDPAPVDVHDEAALRWLRACLWPHDRARMRRFDQAADIVRGAGWPVRQAPDAYAAIEPWLDTLDAGVQPVVFNSWVLAYFEPEARAAHVAAMRALVQRRGIAWLSAEGPGLLLGPAPAVLPSDGMVSADELANATLWWLTLPGAAGAAQATLRARSHPHGRWAHWE